jgi:hypothetical protein
MNVINIQKLCRSIPNDQDLGNYIRAFVNNVENHSNNFVKCIKCGRYQSYIKTTTECKFCNHDIDGKF